MNRPIDDRLLMDLANQVGLKDPKALESMKGKSEQEILSEIMRMKSLLQKNPEVYEKQIRAVKSLRGMMNPQQRQRLDQVLDLLE